MPDHMATLTELEQRIADIRENLRELIEQAAAYSGAAEDDLSSKRITDQQKLLDRLTKERDELTNKKK